MGLRGATALHFDGRQARMGFHDKIDFLAPIPPIIELTLADSCRVRQMGAYRGLNQSAAKFSIRTRLARADAGSHRHQRGVEHLQLWTGGSAARRVTRVLGQAADHASCGQQAEVVRECGCVADVLQLPNHLGVRQHLPGVSAGELEQTAQ
jgi:hypothetical protein